MQTVGQSRCCHLCPVMSANLVTERVLAERLRLFFSQNCFCGIQCNRRRFRRKGENTLKEYLEYCDCPMQAPKIGDSCAEDMATEYTGISKLPCNPVTTMAYVPFQTNTTMYTAEKALCIGTAFPDLDKPFLGGKCV